MQLWTFILDSFRESLDRKIFWVMGLISVFVAAAMACVGFEEGKVSIFFGWWEIETMMFTGPGGLGLRADLIATVVVEYLMDTIVGWIGMVLCIIATASFIPRFVEGGAIDVVLAKPMSRGRLFLYKYLSVMVFVLVQSAVFVLLTFLAAGLRWKTWIPGYLLSIPLLVLLFSYLYCISALVGLKTGSTISAIVVSLGAWVCFFGVHSLALGIEVMPTLKDNAVLYNTVRVADWILPKTQDITYKARQWSGGAESEEAAAAFGAGDDGALVGALVGDLVEVEAARAARSPYLTIGSSLLFEAFIVGWAMWVFSRKDY